MSGWCLSVAGFDPSAGAGVLADAETFGHLGIGSGAVVTAITAQNRTRVTAIHPVSRLAFRQQAQALLTDTRPAAVKIGMLATRTLVVETACLVKSLGDVPVVIDPVLRSSSGRALLTEAGIRALVSRLLPLATVITPNCSEAERLLGVRVRGEKGMLRAARQLLAAGPRVVVVTGGDRPGDPLDVFDDGSHPRVMRGKRIHAGAVRGTGCRLSSAISVLLARQYPVPKAVEGARGFVRSYIHEQKKMGERR